MIYRAFLGRMPHNSAMSILQLLTYTSGGQKVLEARPNPNGLPYRAFEREQREAVLWGNRDLVRVAVALTKVKFRATSVSFVDQMGEPVDVSEAQGDIAEFLSALNHGKEEDAQEILSELFFGLVISRLALRSRQRAMELALHQSGAIEVDPGTRPEDVAQLQGVFLGA